MLASASAHPIDIGIFMIFLVANLVVGLRYGRSVKTLREYALGHKNFSTAAIVSTIVATWITGRYLTSRIAYIYQDGLYIIILYLSEVGALLLIGWVFAMRMGPFLQSTSIAEAMGHIYGKTIRSITAIFGITVSVGLVSLQFMAGVKVFDMLLGWDSAYATVITGSILIIYATLGGVRAVTFTDILQFFTFGTLIPILALIIWNNTRDFDAVWSMIQATPNLHTKTLLTSPKFVQRWDLLTYLPVYIIPALTPAIFQRVVIAKDVYQARRSFLYASLIYLFVSLFIIWIALLIRTQNDNLDFGHVFPYIVANYAPTGFKGLLLVGFVAMMMSTADSNLNAAATILTNDIVIPLLPTSSKSWLQVVKSNKGQLVMVRVGSVILGLLALYFSLNPNSYLHAKFTPRPWTMPWIMPWVMPWDFYMSVISIPVLLVILGFRSTSRTVLIGMVASFLTVYLWTHLLPHALINSVIPGMLANCIGFMGSHHLLGEPGGWQPLDATSPLILERALRRKSWKRRWEAIRAFRIYPYLRQNLPVQDTYYVLLGIYMIFTSYVSFYTMKEIDISAYRIIYAGIYYTVLPIATSFISFPLWPPAVKDHRLMAYLWPIGIGITLFFVSTLLAIISYFHPVQMMVLILNLLMAVLLLRWPLALFLAFTSTPLAIIFFTQYTGTALPAGMPDALQFRFLYGLLLFTCFLVTLLKGKQAYRKLSTSYTQLQEEKAASNVALVEAIHHRESLLQDVTMHRINALTTINAVRNQLDKQLRHATTQAQLVTINKDFQNVLNKLQVLTDHMNEVIHQTHGYVRLLVDNTPLASLLHDVFEELREQNPMLVKKIVTQSNTTCKVLQADISKIKKLLLNGLCYAQQTQQEGRPILFGIENTTLGYPISSIQGHIKKVHALCFHITTAHALAGTKRLYMSHVDMATMRLPKSVNELPITHNQQIVDAHYGVSELIESTQGVTQTYVIPVHVREVRPKTMDLPSTAAAVSDTVVYPAERAFIKDVLETHIDQELLQTAIQLIKKYHAGVKRNSGEPFYLHPVATAHILLNYTKDQDIILAALLHDVVEDTSMSLVQIELNFNPVVKKIVDGVTRLDSNLKGFKRIQLSEHENIQQLLEVKDDRVLYVKLADRLHNMRTIAGHPSLAKQKKIAEETLQFFVPMARNLDLQPLAEELKQLCFAVLNRKI